MPEPTKPSRTSRKKKTAPSAEARRRAESERPARPAERKRAASPKPVNPFKQKLQPSPELARIVGKRALTRVSVIKKVWLYIKRQKLQNRTNKRMIDLDDTLRGVFGDREQVSIFELSSGLMRHLLALP